MRITVDHKTTYRFSVPQGRVTQLLRLTPSGTDGQAVASWGIHVDCDARMRHGRDGFGNRTTMLYVDGPIDSIVIEVVGEVLTNGSDGILQGTAEPLPPAVFLRSTPLTETSEALAGFAADAVSAARDPVERLHALNLALHNRFALDRGRPVSGRNVVEAFELDTATPRDFAQMFVGAARGLGIPARYVSGYSAVCHVGNHPPSPHGWAEAHVERLGWVAFDPCTGLSADTAYARIAVALDSAGAAPVAGSRLGEGSEALDVDLHVGRDSAQD